MKRKPAGRSELLLIEIIIAILFFSIASAICLQIFVKSHTLGEDTGALNMAVTQTSSAAAVLNRPQATLADFEPLFPDAEISADAADIYYNKDFIPCAAADAAYRLNITASENNRTISYALTVSRVSDAKNIYQTEVLTYVPYQAHS